MNWTEIEKDPLTIVREKLWECIDANPVFHELVRESNRIRYEDEIGEKSGVGHGDLPEIIIVPGNASQESMGTSGTGFLWMAFQFLISTGTKNAGLISRLEWELFRVIQTFMRNVDICEYHGNPFVVCVKLESGAQAISDAVRNRGIGGWSALWGVSVQMEFPNNEIIFDLPQNEGENDE